MTELAAYLTRTGETQAAFAARGGWPVNTVWRWCSGDMIPRRANRRKIEKLTDGQVTAVSWFLAEAAE